MAAKFTILEDATGRRGAAGAVRAHLLKPGARDGLLPSPAGPPTCVTALPKAAVNPAPTGHGVMRLPQGTGTRAGATPR